MFPVRMFLKKDAPWGKVLPEGRCSLGESAPAVKVLLIDASVLEL